MVLPAGMVDDRSSSVAAVPAVGVAGVTTNAGWKPGEVAVVAA
jgi:hypothetical protein